MKTTVSILCLALFLVSQRSMAQRDKNANDKVKSLKIAYITQELDLTSKEAEKFWPVYNKYDQSIRELERNERFKIRKTIKDAGGFDGISESKASEILKQIHSIESKIVKTKMEMDAKLADVISKKKILRLKHIEREFVRNLMHKLRKRNRRGMNSKN